MCVYPRMSKLNRKTTAILCAAGGLVATAAIVGATKSAHVDMPPTTPPNVLVPPPPPDVCMGELPARADTVFSAGSMTAALSSSRVLQGGNGEMYLAIDLDARDTAQAARPPMNLAIVIDRSGSMRGDKLAQARDAAKQLVERLEERDRVALVQFDEVAQVLVPTITVDSAGRARLIQAIEAIDDGGETNIYDALALGKDEIARELREGRVNRVILLSDGNATAGIQDIPSLARAAMNAADQGVRISTIGLGADYNEDLMEAVAENGRGRYYYVREGHELAQVFAGELKSIQGTVATQAELRLEPSCAGVEIVEVYGYTTRRDGNAMIVPLADMAGGEHRKIVARLRVPVGQVGKTGVVNSTFSYRGADGAQANAAHAAVGVEVTSDELAVTKATDTSVVAKVAQVETATTMRKAADEYGRGNKTGAANLIQAQRSRNMANQRAYAVPPAAMAPADKGLDELEGDMDANAPGSIGAEHAKKKSKADAYMMSH